MSAVKHEWLRPSALPKLALCGHYRGEKDAGEAANRGTRLDEVFRAIIQKENVSVAELDDAERTAVKWAEATAKALAGSFALEARESELRIEAAGMTGTADLLCEDGRWSADLKTGQIRNYREQQAAYALGFMERYFVDEWTVYLLYCDAEQVETLRFTLESAAECIQDALALYNGGVPPQANEYCGWCASRFDCPARRESLGILPDWQSIDLEKAESVKLRDFVLAAAVAADFVERAREIIKERVCGGEKISGVSLVSKKGAVKLPNDELRKLTDQVDMNAALVMLGDLSEAKAATLLGDALPSDALVQTPGSSYITIRTPKAAK